MDPAGFVRGKMKMHKDEFDLRAKGTILKKWYFVTKIVLTYCEKKLF